MLSSAKDLFTSVTARKVNIDNYVFKLHYRFTFWILVISAALLHGTEFYDNGIKCTQNRSDKDPYQPGEEFDKRLGRWCYVRGIFTIPRHFAKNASNGEVIYPGVGPIIPTDAEQKLYWYQWVSVAMLFQGLFFYVPHGIWRINEGKAMSSLVEGLGITKYLMDSERTALLDGVKKSMVHRIPLMKFWGIHLTFCELLNLVNIVIQWYISDWFLGGNFSKLGSLSYDPSIGEFNPLDVYFPKVAKCTFNKFGPTGEIVNIDILCILTHNVLHEKIYVFMWYWFVLLFVVTSLNLIYRFGSWISHKWKKSINAQLYQVKSTSPPDPRDLDLVMNHYSYSEWLFLAYLLDNCDDRLSSEIISSVATALRTNRRYSQIKKKTYGSLMIN